MVNLVPLADAKPVPAGALAFVVVLIVACFEVTEVLSVVLAGADGVAAVPILRCQYE